MPSLKYLSLLLLASALFSCTTAENTNLGLHKPTDLPSQLFTINPGKDTTIVTQGGINLHIQKGTFTTNVTLEVKEALGFGDMAKYGLSTMSDGKLLSSDGMFYIDAKDAEGKQPAINIPIKADVPATTMLENPQVFNGKADSSGNVNWVNPQKVANDSLFKKINVGENVFIQKCSSCHTIGKGKLVGPDLAYIHKRRTYQWFSDYTHDPVGMTKKGDACAKCLADQYNNTIMPPQSVSDAEMKQLWMYIMKESYKTNEDSTNLGHLDCAILKEVLEPIKSTESQKAKADSIKLPGADEPGAITFTGPDAEARAKKAMENISYVYSMNIKTWGWYNIDSFLEPGDKTKETRLEITVDDYKGYNQVKIRMLLPQSKINADLKPLKDNYFGYDGLVYLPTNQNIYVFATAAKSDKFYSVIQKIKIGDSGLTRLSVKLQESTPDALQKLLDNMFQIKLEKPTLTPLISVDTTYTGYHGERKPSYVKKTVRVPCGLIENTIVDTSAVRSEFGKSRTIKINAQPTSSGANFFK